MTEFRYDTQLLIEGRNLDEDAINDYFVEHFQGDCLLAVGDEDLIKIHYHTNQPWKVLEYCATLGEIYDIVVEDMDRQSRGRNGYPHPPLNGPLRRGDENRPQRCGFASTLLNGTHPHSRLPP